MGRSKLLPKRTNGGKKKGAFATTDTKPKRCYVVLYQYVDWEEDRSLKNRIIGIKDTLGEAVALAKSYFADAKSELLDEYGGEDADLFTDCDPDENGDAEVTAQNAEGNQVSIMMSVIRHHPGGALMKMPFHLC